MKTLYSIQILRAIAAFAVALAHIHGDLQNHMGISLMPVFSLGAVGVDIFFVISGFIMVYVSAPNFARADGVACLSVAPDLSDRPILLGNGHALHRDRLGGARARIAAVHRLGPRSYLFIPFPGANESFPVYSIGWTLNYEIFFYIVFAVAIIWPRRVAVAIISLVACGITLALSILAHTAFERPVPTFLTRQLIGKGNARLGHDGASPQPNLAPAAPLKE